MNRRRLLILIIFFLLLYLPSSPRSLAAQDEPDEKEYRQQAEALFAEMDVAERIGQLFLVTFPGDTAGPDDAISDLILTYKVGGVVLLARNNNITGQDGTVPQQVAKLHNDLQKIALTGEVAPITATIDADSVASTPTPMAPRTSIPLFVATQQEGDGPPYSQLYSGVTQLPSPMAIGATWQPDLAEDVGQIVGQELSTLGINMLLGPSLDVLENPTPGQASDLGVRSFGGSPYWVGLMGQAYTAGVHSGSDGRIAVIAKHFPGRGSSDRPLDEEVSTVRKSLEQLRREELAPFFAVTGGANHPLSVADGLLATHIRYQGFQGNLRDTTPPVSFDPQALQILMGLPEFNGWRARGGLIVSDALGVRAIQRFYDDAEEAFPHRRVALRRN
jgi:beta-N-acetylhexosaminidase